VKVHEIYINRCIQLAKNGLGTTYPNPLVGSVIVYDGKIIGEGWHKKAGEAHAEVNAINAVKDKSLLSQATIYVSLEPCSHFGKTPPCSDLIIKYNIPNVVVGTVDPNPQVAGNGIRKLTEKGIAVTVGVLEKECQELNKRFFTFHNKKRPYIILKWAESADGFIAPLTKEKKEPVWLTNVFSRQLVHKWRSEEQAILVGTTTVIDDNPKLNVRDWKGNNPVKIILDRSGKIASDNAIFDNNSKIIIITEQDILSSNENLIYENAIFDSQLVKKITSILCKNNLQSVIIEGGTITLETFIKANLWDEARVFKSKIELKNGVKAPSLKLNSTALHMKEDNLTLYYNYD
jgi:diaminohydroxyphosphoribosylaminopyrimidine deaminase / 5-amino-6-(5-phosphoribosylamino)uracil reductase